MPPEPLVFTLCPAPEVVIQSAQRRLERGGIKLATVLFPTGEHRPNKLCQILQLKIGATMQPPATYHLTHRLGCFAADCRSKTDKQSSVPVLRFSGSKRIAQKIDLLLRIAALSVRIPAVHDFGLLWMQLQLARRKAPLKRVA